MEYDVKKLLKQIAELEAELKSMKKYGLVWDKSETDENIKFCKMNIPVLGVDKDRIIRKNGLNHCLIEGDNFHSLFALNYCYQGQIDFIYIDPPYNTLHKTGDGGFKYNDKFVDENDMYKHSKFLSFMEGRLQLAYKLLSPTGTIFISIDDHECADLKLLCDQIFGVCHFVTMIPRITKPQRAGQEQYMDISHDYILAYSKDDDFENIIDRDYNPTKLKKDHIGYYIEGDTKAILAAKSQGYSAGGDYDFEYNGKIYKPVTKDGTRNRWLWTRDRMEAAAKLGILVETANTLRMQLYIDKRFEERTNVMVDKNDKLIFHTSDFITNNDYSNPNGVGDLTKVYAPLVDRFNNPKPVKLIKKLIQFCRNKDAVVLDFFAGSGTTGQAVLELNKEDGGNRRFILCTNDENQICSEVTYPRMKTVITGIRPDGTKYSDGLPANLYYFKTDFVGDEANTEQAKFNLVEKVDALLCIAENIFDEVERNDYSSHFKNGDRHLFIYNDYYNAAKFDEFRQRVKKASGLKVVYVYSSDNTVDESLIDGADVTIKPIPSKIYEIYKEIVEDIKRAE